MGYLDSGLDSQDASDAWPDGDAWSDDLAEALYGDLIDDSPDAAGLAGRWSGSVRPTEVLRWTLRAEFGNADDEQLDAALNRMLDSMSPSESFNFGSALSQIGRAATQALADPTVASIARVALPVA